jgi:hypothetical protein
MLTLKFRRNTFLACFVPTIAFVIIVVEKFSRQINEKFPPTWQIRMFFYEQIQSILSGKLHVSSESLPGECNYFNDKCFGYFGLTPSLLRLPFLGFSHQESLTTMFVIVAISLSLIGSFFVFDLIWMNFANRMEKPEVKLHYFLTAVSLIPANLAIQLAFPSGYWEAISWGVAFSIWGVYFILRFTILNSGNSLIFATLLFVLAANSRPTFALIPLTFVVLLLVANPKDLWNKLNLRILALGLMPISTMMLIFWLKFRVLIPSLDLNEQVPESSGWAKIYSINGNQDSSPIFITSNLWGYLRPDSLTFANFPTINLAIPEVRPFKFLWPLPEGGLYSEPTASLTNITPLAVLSLFFICIVFSRNSRLKKRVYVDTRNKLKDFALLRMLLASASSILVTSMFAFNSNRYLGDFVPITIMLISISSCLAYNLNYLRKYFYIIFTLIISLGMIVSWMVAYSEGIRIIG